MCHCVPKKKKAVRACDRRVSLSVCDLDHCGVFFGVLFAGAHKNSPGTHHPESRQCEPSARDRTTYGRARYSTRQFYLHHTRLIAKAAVIHDAMGIRVQVQGLRQRVCAAHAAASGWP